MEVTLVLLKAPISLLGLLEVPGDRMSVPSCGTWEKGGGTLIVCCTDSTDSTELLYSSVV